MSFTSCGILGRAGPPCSTKTDVETLLSLLKNEAIAPDEALPQTGLPLARERKELLKTRWAQLEALVGSENRLALVARDLVEHFEDRLTAMACFFVAGRLQVADTVSVHRPPGSIF